MILSPNTLLVNELLYKSNDVGAFRDEKRSNVRAEIVRNLVAAKRVFSYYSIVTWVSVTNEKHGRELIPRSSWNGNIVPGSGIDTCRVLKHVSAVCDVRGEERSFKARHVKTYDDSVHSRQLGRAVVKYSYILGSGMKNSHILLSH